MTVYNQMRQAKQASMSHDLLSFVNVIDDS